MDPTYLDDFLDDDEDDYSDAPKRKSRKGGKKRVKRGTLDAVSMAEYPHTNPQKHRLHALTKAQKTSTLLPSLQRDVRGPSSVRARVTRTTASTKTTKLVPSGLRLEVITV